MRTCVIFNPVARGDKARRFRVLLSRIAAQASLRETRAPGDARSLASQAVVEEFETVVAAGGDGTIHEVLNGLGDAPDGFARSRLGILPLGTVNVLARELQLPLAPDAAWQVIQHGQEARLDLPWAEWTPATGRERRWFIQLAGAGLDARAVAGVNWQLKKWLGPLAYVLAGFRALSQRAPGITLTGGEKSFQGELVLLGNGRRYGGDFVIFPGANLRDGLLDASVFPTAGWPTVLRCAPALLMRQRLPPGCSLTSRSPNFRLTADEPVPFELDGELVGELPATFGVVPGGLRVIVPPDFRGGWASAPGRV